jgi:KRAB domain-containing zinc finger protein
MRLRLHRGEEPFTCDVCKKSYTWKTQLVAHLRKHAG